MQDEGIGSPREEELEDFHRDSVEIRLKLDKERKLRMEYEEKVRKQICRLWISTAIVKFRCNFKGLWQYYIGY